MKPGSTIDWVEGIDIDDNTIPFYSFTNLEGGKKAGNHPRLLHHATGRPSPLYNHGPLPLQTG